LEAKGAISTRQIEARGIQITDGPSSNLALHSIAAIEENLKYLLEESALFREYFVGCSLDLISDMLA
jgi:hypothetical protein